MEPSNLVDFRGNWPPGEQDVVETAAAEAEAAGLPAVPTESLAPWLVVRQVLETASLYMASRQGADSGLQSRSATGLAGRIRHFAERQAEGPSNLRTGDLETGDLETGDLETGDLETGDTETADTETADTETADTETADTETAGPDPTDDADLCQVIYASEEAIPLSDEDIRELLRKARSKNEKIGVTGLLLHADGRFLQVLEGPKAAVRNLYATIAEDPRHSHVETVLSVSTERRTFPDWKMGLQDLNVAEGETATSDFLQTGTLRGAAEPMKQLVRALQRFKQDRPLEK